MQGSRGRPLCVSEAALARGRRIWQAHNVSLCCSAPGCKGGRRGGEATSRTCKFPNYARGAGVSLPAAVLSLCSSDCDVVGEKKKPTQKNSKLGAQVTPQDLTVWLMSVIGKDPLTGATFSAETACHSSPGGCGERARSSFCGRRVGGRRQRGAGAAPGSFLRQAMCGMRLHRHLLLITECRKLLTIVRLPGAPQTWAD